MRILVSNDDGIQSEGIIALAQTLRSIGEVFVIAPETEQSASSHSLTLQRPLRIRKISSGYVAVDGTPADCVLLGVNSILKDKKPSLVVSGINKGGNLGEDILYSGTVSAATEGTLLGIPSFAISLVSRNDFKFHTAANFALRLAKYILNNGIPEKTFLNVNVPNVEEEEIRSYRITRQGKRIYGDSVVEKIDPRGEKYYWIGSAEPGYEESEESDFEAVYNNYISITPLTVDLTHYRSLERLRHWDLKA